MLPHMVINDYDDFKAAITEKVATTGGTRSGLARSMEAEGILRAHTVRCLLGTPGTRIGRRKPTFDSVLKLARAAGFRIKLEQAS
jgi:DNA-binding phage protein